jgi:hypothetical protein
VPYAQILSSASKAGLSGGAFADTLTVNTGDSLSVANFNNGGARVLNAWGIDSDSIAEVSMVWTRPQATHDQTRGFRMSIPSLVLGGAGLAAGFPLLSGDAVINLYKSDTVTIQVTGSGSDDVLVSWVTEYDDLPGAAAVFIGPAQLAQLHNSTVGIFVGPTASGTAGAYGATRAFNADDDRLHANTWYAMLGATCQTPVTTIGITGPDWGGQRIGLPGGAAFVDSNTWFLDQSIKWNKPLIPCFNSNNKGNINIVAADGEASTQPKINFLLYELTGTPTAGGF